MTQLPKRTDIQNFCCRRYPVASNTSEAVIMLLEASGHFELPNHGLSISHLESRMSRAQGHRKRTGGGEALRDRGLSVEPGPGFRSSSLMVYKSFRDSRKLVRKKQAADILGLVLFARTLCPILCGIGYLSRACWMNKENLLGQEAFLLGFIARNAFFVNAFCRSYKLLFLIKCTGMKKVLEIFTDKN